MGLFWFVLQARSRPEVQSHGCPHPVVRERPDSRDQSDAKAQRANHRMNMKMYVGNLSFQTTKQELEDLFSQYGTVTDAHLPEDRETGRPRGFAFITMDSKSAMEDAIKALDGTEFGGRNLKVNEAKPREDRGGGGGGRGGYGGRR
jgi:RNA recognition motif-containing protein